MLGKLRYYGIDGNEIAIIKSYLSGRRQYVQIGAGRSSVKPVKCGVPQGSILGPLLFLIYLNDFNNLGLFGSIVMFADDLSIFYPYKFDKVLKVQIERDSALVFEYARLNRLVLNPKKTKLLRFRPSSLIINNDFTFFVNGELVKEEHEIQYLGIKLRSNLKWDEHIRYIKGKISSSIGLLFKLRKKLNTETKLMLYQTLIHSHLEFMAIIYAHRESNELKSLQSIQNRALKCVFNLNNRHRTISLYKNYAKNILPIRGLYKRQLLFYVYKSLKNIGNRSIQFNWNTNAFNTRNASNLRLARCRLETTRQRLDFSGSLAFNNLPLSIRGSETLSIFKRRTKEFLLENVEMLL